MSLGKHWVLHNYLKKQYGLKSVDTAHAKLHYIILEHPSFFNINCFAYIIQFICQIGHNLLLFLQSRISLKNEGVSSLGIHQISGLRLQIYNWPWTTWLWTPWVHLYMDFFDAGISHLDIGCSEIPVRTKIQTFSPNNCVTGSPSGKCQYFFLNITPLWNRKKMSLVGNPRNQIVLPFKNGT